ncbi:MAG: NAD(P)/FAD-dependent oxidoreductase [Anaerolineales bacterium]
MKTENVIIIGAGPAGLATAFQLKRYGIHPLLFERAKVGGLLLNANLVENYPGFPQGIPGTDLVSLFALQAQHLNIDVIYEEVIELSYDQGLFQARTAQKNYLSRVAVIASGTKPLHFIDLTIPKVLTELVFYEVYDLLQAAGKCVVIVGSGDAAFDYALNLSKKNQVIILNRSEEPKCLPLLWERVQKVPAISYQAQAVICQLKKSPQGGILIECLSPAGDKQFQADYLVGAIGREAKLDFLSEAFHEQGKVLEEQGVLYLIGDVKNGIYRQTSIAVGEGILAAMKICRQLKETTL